MAAPFLRTSSFHDSKRQKLAPTRNAHRCGGDGSRNTEPGNGKRESRYFLRRKGKGIMKQFICNPYYGQEFEGFKMPKGCFYGRVDYNGDMVNYVITDLHTYSVGGLQRMNVHVLRIDRFGLVTWRTEKWPYACCALARVRQFIESHPNHVIKSHEWESPFDICMYRPTNHTKRTWNVTAIMS